MSTPGPDPTEALSPPQGDGRAGRLPGGLYVTATPIGNADDLTFRARDVLARADLVLCEDTRVSRKLFARHGLAPTVTSYHEHNAARVRPQVLARLAEGAAVALISDAGTPLVSDPGFKLVREVIAEGHRVIPIPGASALLAGLVMAGLPTDRFLMAGFLPSKAGARRADLTALSQVPATLIFYETGPRLAASLADMAAVLGDREAAVLRELTKRYEEARRGPLSALSAHYETDGPPKGELVIITGPPLSEGPPDEADVDAALRAALETLPVRAAAAQVAEQTGLSKRTLYQRALALRAGTADSVEGPECEEGSHEHDRDG